MPVLSPIFLEIAVLVLGLLLFVFEAFSLESDKRNIGWSAISGLTIVFVATFFVQPTQFSSPDVTGLWSFYTADPLALFFKRFFIITTIVVTVMSLEFSSVLRKFIGERDAVGGIGEFYALPVLTCAGLMWMASAIDFIMIFVSLELVTISFYILVSYMRRKNESLEAGVKYLILGALSTGFFVYGITWIFGITGQTNLFRIAGALANYDLPQTQLLFGLLLVIIALCFKIGAAPFQLWVPDVYQGSPTPITAYLSVGSKAAGVIVLLRVLDAFSTAPELQAKVLTLLGVLAGITLIYGNLAAMPQANLKRLLAYSSIGHAGYLLIGVVCIAGTAITFYLASYLLMTLLAFTVMVVVSVAVGGDDINDFRGLAQRSPFLAGGMLIAMLSLAGLPFTAGFLGKFFIFFAAVQQEHWLLVALGTIAVAAGFYYYLKVVRAMYWQNPNDETAIPVSNLTKLTVGVLSALIILFGILPQPLLNMLSQGGK